MNESASVPPVDAGEARSRALEVWIWCAATLAIALVFGWLGALGWPGEASGCLDRFICFCEAAQPGIARQPWNTWSNLPAIALAGWVSWQVGGIRVHATRAGDTRLLRVARVGAVFAVMLWVQGVGSLFFHGALTMWSAVLDALGVFFVGGVLLVTNMMRLGWLRWSGYWKVLLGVLGLGLLYRLYVMPMTAPAVLLLAVGVTATEIACARRRRRQGAAHGESRWFRYGLWIFLLGVVAFGLSLSAGMPLCAEDGGMPGHALWHCTCAAASYFFWLNVRVQLSVPAVADADSAL
ncbi:hypothetical protein [Haliangium ochraceum]|uniref:Ceramidase n=1 Tax=Haliangium ochraceum (strain DSM 14365 / JCM 11303 / SMP-2) TaxID=502025 RepID=D0LMN2_HALO1|nr:hypothetical protein [Haliangium ochraceum]ACY18719.1 hypothetical protein Hoch_6247 [Haliangium ochraceum DSM 14365]